MNKFHILSLSILLVCLGCGSKSEKSFTAVKETMASIGAGAPQEGKADQHPPADAKNQLQRKIKYTADLRLIADDFTKAEEQLLDLVETHKGYIARSDITGSPGDLKQGTWRLRIPLDHFNDFYKAVLKIGEMEKNVRDSEDVTEEYYDLENHIKNRQAELEGLRELMKKAVADKLENLLTVRREIGQVQDDLNRQQGRLKLLANLTDLASVSIQIRERQKYVQEKAPEIAEKPTFGTRVGKVFGESVDNLRGIGEALAIFLVALAPWLPIILILVIPFWIMLRKWWAAKKPATFKPVEKPTTSG